MEVVMSKQLSLWDVDNRLAEISVDEDPLEKLAATMDFERFGRSSRRPPGALAARRAGVRRWTLF